MCHGFIEIELATRISMLAAVLLEYIKVDGEPYDNTYLVWRM